MDRRLVALSSVAALNRRLFLNRLDGLADEDLSRKLEDRSNSVGGVLCHLLDARCYLVQILGGKVENRLNERLRSITTSEDLKPFPTLEELRTAWEQASDLLAGRLELVPPEHLDVPSSDRLPVQDPSTLGALAFLFQHESYHIGQLSLMKKVLTGKPMSYR
jgi:uncharacterized damage-inducible protein DinB